MKRGADHITFVVYHSTSNGSGICYLLRRNYASKGDIITNYRSFAQINKDCVHFCYEVEEYRVARLHNQNLNITPIRQV